MGVFDRVFGKRVAVAKTANPDGTRTIIGGGKIPSPETMAGVSERPQAVPVAAEDAELAAQLNATLADKMIRAQERANLEALRSEAVGTFGWLEIKHRTLAPSYARAMISAPLSDEDMETDFDECEAKLTGYGTEHRLYTAERLARGRNWAGPQREDEDDRHYTARVRFGALAAAAQDQLDEAADTDTDRDQVRLVECVRAICDRHARGDRTEILEPIWTPILRKTGIWSS